jgi:hypothetical protein
MCHDVHMAGRTTDYEAPRDTKGGRPRPLAFRGRTHDQATQKRGRPISPPGRKGLTSDEVLAAAVPFIELGCPLAIRS